MIILFQCSPEVKKLLDELLETGNYKDYSEIINLAIMNLAVLHSETQEVENLFFSNFDLRENIASSNKPSLTEDYHFRHEAPEGTSTSSLKVDSLLSSPQSKSPPYDLPSVEIIDPQTSKVPLDQWIFGQHNRILPVKVSTRAIAKLMLTETRGVSLSQFSSRIAEAAADLAVNLRKIDKKYDLKRDEALAIAFPVSGKRRHKSIERYISQFIAQFTRDGKLTGLLSDLRLIAKTVGSEDHIFLTDAGWEFAALPNPILEGTHSQPPSKLSQ